MGTKHPEDSPSPVQKTGRPGRPCEPAWIVGPPVGSLSERCRRPDGHSDWIGDVRKRPRAASSHVGIVLNGGTTARENLFLSRIRRLSLASGHQPANEESGDRAQEEDDDSRGLLTDSVLEAKWKLEGEAVRNPRPCYCVPQQPETVSPDFSEKSLSVTEPLLEDEETPFDGTAAESRLRNLGPYSTAGVAHRIYKYVKARKSMVDFLAWFQGDFDNYRQVLSDRERGLEPREGGGHEHIHCKLVQVPNAKLARNGDALIFAKYYFNGDPNIVFRQRLYRVFVGNSETPATVEMRIYRMYKEVEEKLRECNYDFSAIDLSDDDCYDWLEGCEVYWRPGEGEHPHLTDRGDHFIGYMKGGGCTVYSVEIGAMIKIKDDLVMTEEDLWVNDRGFDERGNFIYGNRWGVPYKMERVHLSDSTLAWTVQAATPAPSPKQT